MRHGRRGGQGEIGTAKREQRHEEAQAVVLLFAVVSCIDEMNVRARVEIERGDGPSRERR